MQFTLIGFSQDKGFRVFAFNGVADDRTRTEFTVRMDLALTRKYGIRIQELPLLCLALLARRDEEEQEHAFTLTENEMRLHSDKRVAAELAEFHRRQSIRKPVPKIAPVEPITFTE